MSPSWWRTGAIYQVYPRSFQDSDGDGIGDLEGIRRRLDYLTWLGIDAVWISPFYRSPMHDFGYDVADYCAIDPIFGTLETFDCLVEDAHTRRLKIILDFIPNHSSIAHPWFVASRSSRTSPMRDWYIWRDGRPGDNPPNNWRSHFGGSAWEFDNARGQYYYHAYLAEQPDLNWRNPDVRAAMYDVMRFWLRRGADGFRVDVIWHLIKDAAFRDNPLNPAWTAKDPEIDRLLPLYSADQPEVYDVIEEMRAVIDEFEDRVLIGEIYLPLERLVAYYGKDLKGVHLPFNFQLLSCQWTAPSVARLIESYEAALPEGGWPNWVLSNHDRPRIAARVGEAQARVAAMLLLTLRGTPTLYYGDELGIGHVEIPPERVQDPWALREPGINIGRDPSRTPMQWDATPFAGFSASEPWLPVTEDFVARNVAVMREDKTSILNLVRGLLHLRRAHKSLSCGAWRLLSATGEVLAYERRAGEDRIITVLNFSGRLLEWMAPSPLKGRIALSTDGDRRGEGVASPLRLQADEGVVIEMDGC
ncbi:MAG TPA: alpha-amylase family glycosyl hydrolase [Methylocella sp.]|nr:alpha-amylase family glycosyl hydrolase [Methylocella sp.]